MSKNRIILEEAVDHISFTRDIEHYEAVIALWHGLIDFLGPITAAKILNDSLKNLASLDPKDTHD